MCFNMFNVIRTYPAPSSLSLKKEYADKDVVEELQKIFYDKCYLCEDKVQKTGTLEHSFRKYLNSVYTFI